MLKFPKSVSNIVAEMVPTTTVDEIAELVHYVLTEDEMKFDDTFDEPFTVQIATQEEHGGCDDDWFILLQVDKEYIRPQHDWRTVLDVTVYQDTVEHWNPNQRDMSQLTCEQQCFHVAEHIYAYTKHVKTTFESWGKPLSRRHAHTPQDVINVLSGEDTIAPSVRKYLKKLFNRDDMATMQELLPYVEKYISTPQKETFGCGGMKTENPKNEITASRFLTTNRPENEIEAYFPENYPFTFSNFLKLVGAKKTRRTEYFEIQKANQCNDPESVYYYRDGKKGGRKSEIWYTPVGFFAAFDFSRTQFARRVRKLKNKFSNLMTQNIASRNLAAKETGVYFLHLFGEEIHLAVLCNEKGQTRKQNCGGDQTNL